MQAGPGTPTGKRGATGIQDVARGRRLHDGLSDVVSRSMAMTMACVLASTGQEHAGRGEPHPTKATIDNSIASVHALLWADIDGDGKALELVTGKRVYAHEAEPGDTDGSVIAWYDFNGESKSWTQHVIFQGEPAKNAPPKKEDRLALKDFPPGTVGTVGCGDDRHRYRWRRSDLDLV